MRACPQFCADNYYREGGECSECSSVPFVFVAGDLAFMSLLALALLALPNRVLGVAAFVLTTLQLLRLVGKMAYGGLPPSMLAVYKLLSLSTGESLQQPGCGFESGVFLVSWASSLAFLLLVGAGVVAGTYAIAWCRKRVARRRVRKGADLASSGAGGEQLGGGLSVELRKQEARIDRFYSSRRVTALLLLPIFQYANSSIKSLEAFVCSEAGAAFGLASANNGSLADGSLADNGGSLAESGSGGWGGSGSFSGSGDASNVMVLVADPRTVCWEGQHLVLVCLAGLSLVCYTAGLPIAILCFLRRRRTRERMAKPDFALRWGILYSSYAGGRRLFLPFWMLYLVIQAISVAILGSAPMAQFALSASAAVVYLIGMVAAFPFKVWWRNLAFIGVLALSVVGLVINFVTQVDSVHDDVVTLLSWVVIFVLGIAVTATVFSILSRACGWDLACGSGRCRRCGRTTGGANNAPDWEDMGLDDTLDRTMVLDDYSVASQDEYSSGIFNAGGSFESFGGGQGCTTTTAGSSLASSSVSSATLSTLSGSSPTTGRGSAGGSSTDDTGSSRSTSSTTDVARQSIQSSTDSTTTVSSSSSSSLGLASLHTLQTTTGSKDTA